MDKRTDPCNTDPCNAANTHQRYCRDNQSKYRAHLWIMHQQFFTHRTMPSVCCPSHWSPHVDSHARRICVALDLTKQRRSAAAGGCELKDAEMIVIEMCCVVLVCPVVLCGVELCPIHCAVLHCVDLCRIHCVAQCRIYCVLCRAVLCCVEFITCCVVLCIRQSWSTVCKANHLSTCCTYQEIDQFWMSIQRCN